MQLQNVSAPMDPAGAAQRGPLPAKAWTMAARAGRMLLLAVPSLILRIE
jgi:hypothetical protein